MASVQNIGINGEKIKAKNEQTPHSSAMAKDNSPAPIGGKTPTRESAYWFAHSGHEDVPTGGTPDPKAGGDPLHQKESPEEKFRRHQRHLEQQEEERVRRGRELELQFSLNKKHREQQEEERRRRIEEARCREQERRHQVEERKRQIWEAEQERKEAILRRNMEREARIEARRNAQRNSQCFAFGSSTPRSFDLDLAAIGVHGSVLMCAVGKRPEEREVGPPRSTSSCSLDRKMGEDLMSRSMVSLSSSSGFRGRKRTDILPTMSSRERSATPHGGTHTPRGNYAMRAVSMTRLDQLAQPRRTYFNHTPETPPTAGPRTVSPSMSRSMCNLANSTPTAPRSRGPPTVRSNSRNSGVWNDSRNSGMWNGGDSRNSGGMWNSSSSRSMLQLPGSSPQQRLSPSPTGGAGGMRPAKSMLQLAPPRLTRAARLRAEALAGGRAASAWNLSNGQSVSAGKDSSRSPSRPHSSLSGTSDMSATSSSMSTSVQMRPRPAPRRPRPFSVAGSIVDASTLMTQSVRQPRMHDRNASAPAAKPQRAKSANRESSEFKNTKPLTAPRKPVLPPKPTELLAKAKSHPVPIKDNLRKVSKPTNKTITSESKPSTDAKEKSDVNQNGMDKVEVKKDDVPESKQTVPTSVPNPSSTLTSPTSDSDMLPTSNTSEVNGAVESDVDTLSQSITEQEESKASENIKSPPELAEQKTIPKDSPSKAEDAPNTLPSSSVAEPAKSSQNKKQKEGSIPSSMTQSLYVKKDKDEGIPASMTTSLIVENGKEFAPSKPRITSEEEARAALAEKRRLAREQLEREAELERQRLEEIERKEEEQRQLEEQEQRRMEEEQIRLAELHRQLEQEKLSKAIEEQKLREKEEQEKREEEARQKAEREEQEKKAREEAEKQRLEMEEKLRKEEEERAERKRRVEQIMARTRGKAAAAQSPSTPPTESKSSATTPSPATEAPNTSPANASSTSQVNLESSSTTSPANESSSKPVTNGHSVNGKPENYVTNSWPFSEEGKPLPDLLSSSSSHNGSFAVGQNGSVSNRTLSANEDVSPQTNGYSSHEEMSCTTSPEESADLLIDIQSCQQRSSKVLSESVDFTKLVEVDPPSLDNDVNNENYLIHVDDVNSNLFNSANPFVGFEDSMQQKQDTSVTDLLS